MKTIYDNDKFYLKPIGRDRHKITVAEMKAKLYRPADHEDLTSPGAAIIVSICVAGMALIGLAIALTVWGW